MTRITLFVEGGGNKELNARCRRAFRTFLRTAGLAVVPGGGRADTYKAFRTALRQRRPGGHVMLLVDSEGPVSEGRNAWQHLQARDKWERPTDASDDDAHLMVQCMEAWFLADKDVLERHFGRGFATGALPANPRVEQVPMHDITDGLDKATRRTRKRGYRKGRDSFAILGELYPARVGKASRHAERLLRTLRSRAAM